MRLGPRPGRRLHLAHHRQILGDRHDLLRQPNRSPCSSRHDTDVTQQPRLAHLAGHRQQRRLPHQLAPPRRPRAAGSRTAAATTATADHPAARFDPPGHLRRPTTRPPADAAPSSAAATSHPSAPASQPTQPRAHPTPCPAGAEPHRLLHRLRHRPEHPGPHRAGRPGAARTRSTTAPAHNTRCRRRARATTAAAGDRPGWPTPAIPFIR